MKTCIVCGMRCDARRTYCSRACKQRAYRVRRRARVTGRAATRARLLMDIQYVRQISEVASEYCTRVLYLYGEDECNLALDAVFHLLEASGKLS